MSSDSVSPKPTSASEWTVRKVLEWTTAHLKKHGSDTPRLDAEVLLSHARGCQRIQLYTAYDEPLSDAVRATMRDLVQRRAQAEPVAYLVGHREFFSLDFRVTHDVLIPRPDTETLVMEILDAIKLQSADASGSNGPDEPGKPLRVLDLCTGSGCVVIAVAKQCHTARLNVQFVATDISPGALQVARDNATKHGVQDRIEFLQGDLFAAIPEGMQFDIIASNPPYVATTEIEQLDPEVSRHEPRLALDGGPSGFDVIDRLIRDVPRSANPSALFLMELSPEQAERCEAQLRSNGSYSKIGICKDLSGRARVIKAECSGRSSE